MGGDRDRDRRGRAVADRARWCGQGRDGPVQGGPQTRPQAGGKSAWCKIGFGTCFTAGTPIRTRDGDRPIEDLRPGDLVWARNVDTGLDELHPVTETFERQTATLYHLTVDGQRISTTDEHPFRVQAMGWTEAKDLHPGDHLVTDTGTVRLTAVVIEHLDRDAEPGTADGPITVYNFHVHTHHNYYVLADNTPVLVHNAGGHGAGRVPKTMEDCSDAAFQGVSHVRDEIAREGANGSHSWAAKMSDDEPADYFDGFAEQAAKGGGSQLKAGGVGWYDSDHGVMVVYRNEYSMSTYSVTPEKFATYLES